MNPDKSTGIFTIAMLPIRSRYTEEWYGLLRSNPRFAAPVPARSRDLHPAPYNYFTNLEDALEYEADQLVYFLFALPQGARKLFLVDLDFPGLTAAVLPLLRLKFPHLRLYSMLHAGSWIKGDLFANDPIKPMLELAAIRCCEKVFVATTYHRDRICEYFGMDFDNLIVTDGFPFDAARARVWANGTTHARDVLVTGRREQMDLRLPDGLVCDYHLTPLARSEFVRLLATYKIAILPKVDETFGLTALECASVGTIPFVPADFSYRELLPDALTYRSKDELPGRVREALADPGRFQGYLNQIDLDRFVGIFDEIADEIEKE